jgi:hypothetical protein
MQKRAFDAKNSQICTEDGANRPFPVNEYNSLFVAFYLLTTFVCLGMTSNSPIYFLSTPGVGRGMFFCVEGLKFIDWIWLALILAAEKRGL